MPCSPHDTSRGADLAFPTTCWSRILGKPAGRDLEALARAYWRPVYGAVRARGVSHDDAVDATQDFFARLLQSDLLDRADPARGRFRAFLKVALANFLAASHRRATAAKRGGGRPVLRLDPASGGAIEPADLRGAPDAVLDRLWRTALVERALEALEVELRRAGRGTCFEVFRDYYLSADELDYAAVAARYGISTAQVSNALQHAKRRYRAQLRAAVRETVSDPDELEQELAWLFGSQG